jgi:hypothetical protein
VIETLVWGAPGSSSAVPLYHVAKNYYLGFFKKKYISKRWLYLIKE